MKFILYQDFWINFEPVFLERIMEMLVCWPVLLTLSPPPSVTTPIFTFSYNGAEITVVLNFWTPSNLEMFNLMSWINMMVNCEYFWINFLKIFFNKFWFSVYNTREMSSFYNKWENDSSVNKKYWTQVKQFRYNFVIK